MKVTTETRLTLYIKDPDGVMHLDPELFGEDGWYECISSSMGTAISHMISEFRKRGVKTKLVEQEVRVTEEVLGQIQIHEDL